MIVILTLSDVVAVLCVVVEADNVVGPTTIVFAVCESDVVAVDWVLSVGLTVVMSAVSVLAVRDSSGVCADTMLMKDARRLTTTNCQRIAILKVSV